MGPCAKFDRKIEQNSEESSEWKEFFDSIEKKEEIDCKKIFQLGKKIHCIFAFAQKWQFDEEFKGYFLGQKDYKEIHDEIKSETRFKNYFDQCFEKKLHERRLEDGVCVDRFYTEERLMCRTKYSMNHMLKSIKKELNRFSKGASDPGAQGGSYPAGGDDGADGSKNKGQKRPRKKRSDAGKKCGAKGGPEGASGSGAKPGSDPAAGGHVGADGSKNKVLGSDSDSE